MTERIKAGQQVTWKSQAQGGVREKTGTVIAFVPSKADARVLAPAAFAGSRTFRRFDYSVSVAVDRYVVEVLRTSARGKQLPSHYYAPLASVLEAQNAAADV